jgi:hypothetical protein
MAVAAALVMSGMHGITCLQEQVHDQAMKKSEDPTGCQEFQ